MFVVLRTTACYYANYQRQKLLYCFTCFIISQYFQCFTWNVSFSYLIRYWWFLFMFPWYYLFIYWIRVRVRDSGQIWPEFQFFHYILYIKTYYIGIHVIKHYIRVLCNLKTSQTVYYNLSAELVTIPTFKFLHDNNSGISEKDQKSLSLKKASEKLKIDGQIFTNLAEAQYYLKYSAPDVSIWVSWPGFLLEGLIVVVILLLLSSGYLL